MSVNDAQQFHHNLLHFLRVKKALADITSGTSFSVGWVPAGATVYDAYAIVDTAFNSGTSDLLDIGFENAGDGTTSDPNEFMTAVSIASVGKKAADELATAGDLRFPSGAQITATWTGAGTAATTGNMDVVVLYAVDNDGNTTS